MNQRQGPDRLTAACGERASGLACVGSDPTDELEYLYQQVNAGFD